MFPDGTRVAISKKGGGFRLAIYDHKWAVVMCRDSANGLFKCEDDAIWEALRISELQGEDWAVT
jgi:hypothetical protein